MAGKLSYKELEKRIHGLESLFNLSPDLLCVADFDGYFRIINSAFENTLGHSRQVLLETPFIEFVHPDDKVVTLAAMEKLTRGESVRDFENRYRCKDGTYKWLAWNSVPVVHEGFEYAVGRDITERRLAAAALANSERRFHAIFNSTFQFIGLLKPDGVLLEANQAALDFVGLTNADVVGKPFWETPWWTHSPQFQKRLKEGISEAAHGEMVRFEAIHIGTEGQRAVIDFSLKPVLNEQDETVLIIPEGRDITELRQTEEELRRHQQEMAHVMRLSTMGEMATGIAHELNQPLTALTSYCGTAATIVKTLQSPNPQLVDILERAGEQVHRAGQIIRHLREFISTEDGHKAPIDIDQTIKRSLELLKPEVKRSNLKIEYHPGPMDCKIMANSIQIEQVLLNLLLNSIEAINCTKNTMGKIIIETHLLPDNTLETSVSDNGPGVAADIADKIFDAFKTSKSSGLGMGLAISRSIIEAHGGKLWVDLQQSNGALFGFKLPVIG